MKLNSKNIFALYYRWIYGKLPSDICTYFWGTVLIILISPIVVPGRLVWFANHYSIEDELKNGGYLYLFYIIVSLVGFAVVNKNFEIEWTFTNVFFIPFITGVACLLVIFIGIAIIALIGFLIEMYQDWRSKRKAYDIDGIADYQVPEEKKLAKIFIWYGAIRNKYCTKIEWE